MKNQKTSISAERDRSSTKGGKDEPFLRRWSKRKLKSATTSEEKVDAIKKPPQTSGHENAQSPALDNSAEQPERELTDEDMPPLEALNENSDYSGFFSPKVSETLKREALHKLFHFQQFNITDGLNDYDEDYTNFAKLGNTVTHEMKRMLERETEASKEKKGNDENKQDAEIHSASENEADEKGGASTESLADTNAEKPDIDKESAE